jgi:hypothetical protein
MHFYMGWNTYVKKKFGKSYTVFVYYIKVLNIPIEGVTLFSHSLPLLPTIYHFTLKSHNVLIEVQKGVQWNIYRYIKR